MARRMLDQHRRIGAEKVGFVLQIVGVIHAPDHLADAAAQMGADEFQLGEFLENAADDEPAQGKAEIERTTDTRCQPVFLHPLLAEAEMRRMNHDRYVEFLDQLPERTRFVVVRVMSLVTGVNENALETEFTNGALGLLDEGWPAARQDGGEAIKRTFVGVLNLRGIIAPPLYGGKLVLLALAAQIMSGVGHHADVNARLVMRVEEILEHHRTTMLAPGRSVPAVEGPPVVGRFLRRVDVCMPIDDHAWSHLILYECILSPLPDATWQTGSNWSFAEFPASPIIGSSA